MKLSQQQLNNLQAVVKTIALQISEENPTMNDLEVGRLAKDIVIKMVAREFAEGNV